MQSMKKRGYRKFHKRYHSSKKNYTNGCAYCGRDLRGLPHKCKFCGQIHCSKHLLPEDHNCQGLKHPKHFGDSIKKENYLNSQKRKDFHYPRLRYNHHHRSNFNFHMPKIRLPRISQFFKALIVALLSYFLATYFLGNDIFLWLEAGAWIYFSFVFYKKAFRWANRVSMADDLSFFGLRVLGAIVTLGGIYFGFAVLFASVFVKNSAQIAIPLACLLLGLIALGAFIAFRTNRRHPVVGIWRA